MAWAADTARGGLRTESPYRRNHQDYHQSSQSVPDGEELDGFQVRPVWPDDEGTAIRRAMKEDAREPLLVAPIIIGPDRLSRPFPFRKDAEPRAHQGSPAADWDGLRERFARYRHQLDAADAAAFHRVCDLWQSLLAEQDESPSATQDWIAWGEFLDQSPMLTVRPAQWYQRVLQWLASPQSSDSEQAVLDRFPNLKALVEATGIQNRSRRGSADRGP